MSLKDYELGKKLGEGAFGSVCVVTNKVDKKVYAMKRVHLSKLDKKERENALNEIRILYSLHHKNIIGYKDGFYDDSTHTLNIIMELADDGDIAGKIKYNQKKKLQFKENTIWKILIQIIQGLKYLHDNKIIHRDLKSANIFLDKNGTCKIGDMNVSKVIKNSLLNNTQTGTPYYASPEIWKDKPYNFKTDIWSLGCILYEMCTLKPPFIGKSFEDVFNKIISGKFKTIPGIYSHSLRNVINNLLKVRSEERPNCDMLLKWMDSMPIKSFFRDCEDDEVYNNNNNRPVSMISTLKMPKQMKEINKILPKANYSNNTLSCLNINNNTIHKNEKNENMESNRNSHSAFCKNKNNKNNKISKCNTGVNNVIQVKQININNSSSIDSFDITDNKFNVNKVKNKVPKLPKINLKKKNFHIPFGDKKDKKIFELNTKSKSLSKINNNNNLYIKTIKEKKENEIEKENSPI